MVRVKHEVSLPKGMPNFTEMEKFSPYEKKINLILLCFPVLISSSTLLNCEEP